MWYQDGKTALIIAAEVGELELTTLLLQRNAKLSATDNVNYICVHSYYLAVLSIDIQLHGMVGRYLRVINHIE